MHHGNAVDRRNTIKLLTFTMCFLPLLAFYEQGKIVSHIPAQLPGVFIFFSEEQHLCQKTTFFTAFSSSVTVSAMSYT
ncbi:hypothetical protein ALT1000_350011 [Alteromonas macleodii]